ncbi:MAG: hypothetical protein K0R47_276 [Brevibacillus sp.]|nr:hypothetical protein [Brevibacillus sp.]
MHQFMIGLYGGFDAEKYKRDFRKGFYGIEACLPKSSYVWIQGDSMCKRRSILTLRRERY